MDLYPLLRPLLFRLDPETAHRATLGLLDLAARTPWCGMQRRGVPDDPTTVMGLEFPNRVGLAAGLDKNAAHIAGLSCLGFGFIEVGTLTPRAQPGNAAPRLFRLADAEALINRMGFNNDGIESALANIAAAPRSVPLGINLGKNFDTPIESALDDYRAGLAAVYAQADYVTINISSPNTANLRNLQGGEAFTALLAGLAEERERLRQESGRHVPLAIKIAPDLEDEEVPALVDALVAHGIDAVIATNTTIGRPLVSGLPNADEAGGLSGRPVRERSTEVIAALREHLPEDFPIIGVGGIDSGETALEKIRAGADLVQVYTGLIYRGPALVGEIAQALVNQALATSEHAPG
ncbi:quinone-dependent dihydroorotate dehydrogenase [Guyparkeria sp. GHLCS8-2]|uniref:quinone-dependent dihydroorotate dehydrogenase n=1 Tax=Guyparkeria halopsychrophila TaxID=3139421 RepID=UPI0037C99B91